MLRNGRHSGSEEPTTFIIHLEPNGKSIFGNDSHRTYAEKIIINYEAARSMMLSEWSGYQYSTHSAAHNLDIALDVAKYLNFLDPYHVSDSSRTDVPSEAAVAARLVLERIGHEMGINPEPLERGKSFFDQLQYHRGMIAEIPGMPLANLEIKEVLDGFIDFLGENLSRLDAVMAAYKQQTQGIPKSGLYGSRVPAMAPGELGEIVPAPWRGIARSPAH